MAYSSKKYMIKEFRVQVTQFQGRYWATWWKDNRKVYEMSFLDEPGLVELTTVTPSWIK